MDISGFGGNFTANIAAEIVKRGVTLLRDATMGDAESRTLTHQIAAALGSALSEVQLRGLLNDEAALEQAKSAIEMIFRAEPAAISFVSAALTGQGEAEGLASLAESAGLDPSTLPFDWHEFLALFLASLDEGLHREAYQQGSPLRDRVALSELFRLRCAVAGITSSITAVIERLTAELCQVDPTASFDQFMYEYLGLPGRPKPFGGRRHEIDRLNNWVYDPQNHSKLLLVAPAGKGKSALLVHWLRQLPQDIATVFVPVSLRFQTAQPTIFLPALASRLARLHGQQLPLSTFGDVNACRSVATDLMRRGLPNGRPLVVVIDGLDEAGDRFAWGGLLPNDAAQSVRLVVSARQLAGDHDGEHWMRLLGWNSFSETVRPLALGGLDESGLREVLEGMQLGIAKPSAEIDIVAQLYRLTSGDPLLIGLYAQALWDEQRQQVTASPWRPVDLKDIKPGLKGFFQHWLEGQQLLWGDKRPLAEAQVRAVLSILAQALAPMRTADLRELMRRAYGISSWSVPDTLAPIARFVIGDGTNQGYTFSHPRLAEFFGTDDYIDTEEAARVRDSFLAWGNEVLRNLVRGTAQPASVPYYLLSSFGEHLTRAGGPTGALMSLICIGWLRSWEKLDPTHRGFLGDVYRAWNAARADVRSRDLTPPIPAIAREFQCLLCVCSVQSPHELPAKNVFAAALGTDLVTSTQVLSVLASMFDRPNFEEYVRELAPLLAGSVGMALANLADLRPPSYAKVTALLAIANQLKEPDFFHVIDKAFRAARGCKDEFEKVYAAIALIPHTSVSRRRELANRAIDELQRSNRQLILAEPIIQIFPFVGSAILPWAKRVIEAFFQFSANWLEPLAPSIFDLLSKDDQDRFVLEFLTRPIELSIADDGRLLSVVSPYLSGDQWSAVTEMLEKLGVENRITILSAIVARVPITRIAGILDRSINDLASQPTIAPRIDSVNWTDLLPVVDTHRRAPILDALVSFAPLATSSDYWLRVLPQALPFLERREKHALAGQAMSQGQLHHDEAAVLPLLGSTIKYLPQSRQSSAHARLEERIRRHVERVERSGEWRRLVSLGSLLKWMEPHQASALAERIFDAQRSHDSLNVSSILEIIHYLQPSSHDQAVSFLVEWSRKVEAEFSSPGLLLEARKWLCEPDFLAATERLYMRANAEEEPRLRAMALAYQLRLLPAAERNDLIGQLVSMAQEAPLWDASWSLVIRLIIETAEPFAIECWVLPFLGILQERQRIESFLLLIHVAIWHADLRGEVLRMALGILPLVDWPLSELVDALSILPSDAQAMALEIILRELPNEHRGRPLGFLAKIFPTLSEVAGEEAAADVWETIWDVTQWWP